LLYAEHAFGELVLARGLFLRDFLGMARNQ